MDPRWELLDDARASLAARLAEYGVVRVEYLATFPENQLYVWLGTATDVQRDQLGLDNPLLADIKAALLDAGLTRAQLSGLRSTAESQETVDRDYQGNWGHAMR